MLETMLPGGSAVKRKPLSAEASPLPFVSMSASTPGEDSTLGERLDFAIKREHHRTERAVERGLRERYPGYFKGSGFINRYVNGKRGTSTPDPRLIKMIADFLHVSFEWLLLGSGPMLRAGRGKTPAEEALFIARDWGIREDAWEVAWERNKDRADDMTAEEWFDAIRAEAEHLDKKQVPRPESVAAAKIGQRRVRRAKERIQAARSIPAPVEMPVLTPAIPPPRRVATK